MLSNARLHGQHPGQLFAISSGLILMRQPRQGRGAHFLRLPALAAASLALALGAGLFFGAAAGDSAVSSAASLNLRHSASIESHIDWASLAKPAMLREVSRARLKAKGRSLERKKLALVKDRSNFMEHWFKKNHAQRFFTRPCLKNSTRPTSCTSTRKKHPQRCVFASQLISERLLHHQQLQLKSHLTNKRITPSPVLCSLPCAPLIQTPFNQSHAVRGPKGFNKLPMFLSQWLQTN